MRSGANIALTAAGALIMALIAVANIKGYLNPDSAWLLSAAERWLSGEKLYEEVIESNPPLVVYISALPVLLAQYLDVSPVEGFVYFVTALALVSFAACCHITKDNWLRFWVFLSFFIIPAVNFGQREHLFLIFFIPYFLNFVEGKKQGFLVPAVAALGIALKPYFIIFWAVLVITKTITTRKWKTIFEPGNFIIGLLLVAYASYVLFFEQDYIARILPWMLRYYGAFALPLADVLDELTVSLVAFIPAAIVYIVACVKEKSWPSAGFFYSISAMAAAFVVAMIQLKGWPNHVYPLVCFGAMLIIVIFSHCWKKRKELWNATAAWLSGVFLAGLIATAVYGNYSVYTREKAEDLTEIIQVMDYYAAGNYVYIASFNLPDSYPALLYSQAKSSSRYAHFWMLPGIYLDKIKDGGEIEYNQPGERSDDETLVIAQILGDISYKPPMLIIVTNREFVNREGKKFRFDFINYLSQEPEFVRLFANYERIKKIGNQEIYLYKN